MAAANHEERQIDRQTTRPRPRSLKAAGPWQQAMQQARDRDMDRHAMQSEVGYLFSGLWKGRGEGGRAEREAEGVRGEVRRRERQKLSL